MGDDAASDKVKLWVASIGAAGAIVAAIIAALCSRQTAVLTTTTTTTSVAVLASTMPATVPSPPLPVPETLCTAKDWNSGTLQPLTRDAIPGNATITAIGLHVGPIGGDSYPGTCPVDGPPPAPVPGNYEKRQCEPATYHDMTVEAVGTTGGATQAVSTTLANGTGAPPRRVQLCVTYTVPRP